MMTRIDTPQTRCRVGFARQDITPPVGIYHRMWGAALHDRSTGVHRPLTATALWLESLDNRNHKLILGLDHCLLPKDECDRLRMAIGRRLNIAAESVFVCLSHTHGSAWMARSRSHYPGGELIGPYLDELANRSEAAALAAVNTATVATLLYGTCKCGLAAHRDFWDAQAQQFVCGFNPSGAADETVLVIKAVTDEGRILGTVVNYACHPTTLAWENTLISPDYVGAMREVVEQHTGAPCLFLQAASGDLGPREGYVGDVAVADRNGRQLGFSALSGLEALPAPGTYFAYTGPVLSGAVLGTWKHFPLETERIVQSQIWQRRDLVVRLPYRLELPTPEATRTELLRWQEEEAAAHTAGDTARLSEARARSEQMVRQLARLDSLPEGSVYPLLVTVSRLGGAIWIFTPGELYQKFQQTLRNRFPTTALVIGTITNDWQPGYIPAVESYGYGIYQETIAAVAPGSLEVLIEVVSRELQQLSALES